MAGKTETSDLKCDDVRF